VLTETPLLVTIAAKVYLERKSLPERRSQLYQEFVDIWLDEARERGLRDELDTAVLDLAQPALAHLALAMTEHPEWTDEKSLIPVVANYLDEQLGLKDRAERVARRFLHVMARRSGIFLRTEYRLIHFSQHGDAIGSTEFENLLRRLKTYGWLHPTFREYLAAWLIVRDCHQDLECVWKLIVSKWEHENWAEVALFAIGIIGENKDVTPIVERLLNEEWMSDWMGEWLLWQPVTRHYLFPGELGALAAGAALLEDIVISKAILCDVIREVMHFYSSSTLNKSAFKFIAEHPQFLKLLSACKSELEEHGEMNND